MKPKNRFGDEVEEYLRLKGKTTRFVYSSASSLFLEFYQSKHGEGKGFSERQKKLREEKYMPISRSRAYQILQQIDSRIEGPHWFRHMRLSHLAETLNPYQLKERIGFWENIDPAVSYVHGRVSDYLEACEKARGVPS